MQEPLGQAVSSCSIMWPGHGLCRCPAALQLPPYLARLPKAGGSSPAHHPAHFPARWRCCLQLHGTSAPSPHSFLHQKLQGTRLAPFGNCSHCYQHSLAKKGGKYNLSEVQTFTRPLLSETPFVENFKVTLDNLGWGEQTQRALLICLHFTALLLATAV